MSDSPYILKRKVLIEKYDCFQRIKIEVKNLRNSISIDRNAWHQDYIGKVFTVKKLKTGLEMNNFFGFYGDDGGILNAMVDDYYFIIKGLD